MKKLIFVSFFLTLQLHGFSLEKQVFNESLEKQIAQNKELISLLKYEIKLLENNIAAIRDNNTQQLDYYKENQTTIFWMVSIFIGILGGAFVLFTYLFKRPDEILKKITDSDKQSKLIIAEAKFLLERLDFQYEHQESIFILNKKSLFNYTENDWDLVEIYSNNAKEVDKDKRTANDWIFIGLSSFKNIKIEQSINAFKRATEINPEYEIAWKHLGNAYDKNNEFENAINAFNKVIELNPNNDVAFNNLGIEYTTLGNFVEAERNFLISIRLNPNNCYAYTNYFELCLVNDVPFNPKLVEIFEGKFSDNKNAKASYGMLSIYNKIIQEEDIDLKIELEEWKTNCESAGWDESYREIEVWIDKQKSIEIKKQLMTALNYFSSDSVFRNYS